MQPEQATFLRDFLIAGIENEFELNKKVIAAIPQAKCDYKPEKNSRCALELAWHQATVDLWFLDSIANGEFKMEMPEAQPKTVAEVLAMYEKEFPKQLARVKALPTQKLTQPISFLGMYNQPAVTYLHFLNNHTIHHRGQISAYLRPMGSKVPKIYGGSYDEPMDLGAHA